MEYIHSADIWKPLVGVVFGGIMLLLAGFISVSIARGPPVHQYGSRMWSDRGTRR